jgi:hypothetical protein
MATQLFEFPFSFIAAYLGAWLGVHSLPSPAVPRASWERELHVPDCVCHCGVPWASLVGSFVLGGLSVGTALLGWRCGWCRGEWSLGAATQGGVAVGSPVSARTSAPGSSRASLPSSVASVASTARAIEESLAVWAPRRPRGTA